MSEPIFNIHDTLLLATAFQSFSFVLLILIAKRDPHVSDYFLIGFFLAQTIIPIHLLIIYGEQFRFIALELSPNLFRVFEFAYWLQGPLLLWYTRALLYREFSLSRIDPLYLLPALVYLLYSSTTFFSWEDAAKVQYIEQYHQLVAPSLEHGLEAARETVFAFFIVLCLLEIRHAQQQVHHRYSNIEKVEFAWLGWLVIAIAVTRFWSLAVVGLAFLQPDLGVELFDMLGLTGNYLMFAMINVLIFFSLTRTSIFAGKLSRSKLHAETEEIEIDPVLTRKIEQHMQDSKPHLSHLLNLDELAKQLEMHPRALSQAIKQQFNTNFYEFINGYRIEEAKRMLGDPEQPNRTMIEILDEAGFNSKATFNSFFKKLVGMTPTQYKASLKEKAAGHSA